MDPPGLEDGATPQLQQGGGAFSRWAHTPAEVPLFKGASPSGLSVPHPWAPHLLLLAPSPLPTQTPIHPAAGQELYIEPCRQAMARNGHWPLSPGDPAPGHTAPPGQLQALGPPALQNEDRGTSSEMGLSQVPSGQWRSLVPSARPFPGPRTRPTPGILRTLPQREGTAHPAAQSLKSCSPPTHPTLPPPHSPPLPHPHPLASCSLGTAPRQTLSPVHRPGPALQGVE